MIQKAGQIKSDTCNHLINWIKHYLDLASLSDEVKDYAVDYWQDALKVLESEFRLDHNLETADVLCP